MISSQDLKDAYVRLYSQMRKYIWEYRVVEKLAELEVLIYTAFVDHESLKEAIRLLKNELKYTDAWEPDDTLQTCFTGLEDKVNNTQTYIPLTTFNEVI